MKVHYYDVSVFDVVLFHHASAVHLMQTKNWMIIISLFLKREVAAI